MSANPQVRKVFEGGSLDAFETLTSNHPTTTLVNKTSSAFHRGRVLAGGAGFPFPSFEGAQILVFDRLGPHLQQFLDYHKTVSTHCACLIAIQLISRLEYMHSRLIFCELSIDNIVFGTGIQSLLLHIVGLTEGNLHFSPSGGKCCINAATMLS